jgi:DNA-binding transcriptional regulator of glucitol operon
MYSIMWLLAAVVAGWMVQLYVTYQQSMAFNAQVRKLRTHGTVSVGGGGRRYRGGRAFVAIAVDEGGTVRDSLCLRGFTTFARGRGVPELLGLRVNVLRGDREIDGLSRAQREACRQAAELLKLGTAKATGLREAPVS